MEVLRSECRAVEVVQRCRGVAEVQEMQRCSRCPGAGCRGAAEEVQRCSRCPGAGCRGAAEEVLCRCWGCLAEVIVQVIVQVIDRAGAKVERCCIDAETL